MPRPTIELDYDRIVHETPDPTLYDLGDGDETWIPKSVVEVGDGEDGGVVEVQEWFAEKEGLI